MSEARIAELRARRRARLRVLAVRSAFLGVGVFLLAVLALTWLLNSVGGRDLLLRQVVARLPAGTTLAWSRAEGPASGPLTLHDVRFSMPRQRDPDCVPTPQASCAMGTIRFRAALVVLDPAIRPLLGRRLRLDALVVRDAALDLPRGDKPFELPRWPESLPGIAPPLALQADDIRIDRLAVAQEAAPLVSVRSARGGLDASQGRLHVEHLAVDSDRGRFALHGDYAPGDDYRSDLVATAVLPAPAGRTPPRLGLVARGDLSHLVVALSGNAPAPVRATLVLDDDSGGERPRWSLRAGSEALDPAWLAGGGEPGTPASFALQADGTAGDMRLQGRYAQGGFAATLEPSHLILADQVLTLQPLAVELFEGGIRANGRVDLRRTIASRGRAALAQPDIQLAVNARGLRLRGGAGASVVEADADLGIAGTADAWAAIGHAALARDGRRAQLQFDGRGDRSRAAVKRLHATMPTGTLDASGEVRWSPSLAWTANANLAGFDPGYFLPDWQGAVDGRIAANGTARDDGGLEMRFDAQRLGGRLRGRALGGHGTLAIRTPGSAAAARGAATAYTGDVALALGASRVQATGTFADALDVRAQFSPLRLDDLLPGAAGTLRGSLALGGARTAPDVTADLLGDGLRYGGWAAASLRAHGHLPWRGSGGALVLDAGGVEAGTAFDRLHAQARGSMEHLQLEADASGELGSVSLAGGTDRRNGLWRASLARLRVQPAKGGAWALQAPTSFAQQQGGWRIGRSCVAPVADAGAASDGAAGSGTLCAAGGWPSPGLDIEGRNVPLALAAPWLPERSDGRAWLLRGAVALDAHVQPAGNAWRGTLHVASPDGGMRNSRRSREDLVGYRDLALDARFDAQRVEATMAAIVNGDGHLRARVATGWDAYAPLSGEVALDTDELTWMELFSPDIVDPTGKLAGRVTLGGTRAAPTIGGNARLTAFATEIPALAIAPHDGDIRLDALPDGSARIAGTLVSGDGTLRVDGTLGWQGDDTPLVLDVRGKDVLVADTRDLHAVVDPDVVVRYAAKQPLQVTGTVTVPEARIDLERLDMGASVSGDVVVLDPENPEEGLATPLQLDLALAMGKDVRLNGFGLDGTLGGQLRVRSGPGQEMSGNGALDVGGRYTAYGQKLDITRGRLLWQNGPIDDPMLDIRAERDVGDVTAGIAVTGRASRPQAEVWSDPAMDQSEALAYLALGRPLSTVTGDESRQLDAASAALSAGSSLLASQLGARIGLDDAGVTQSRALGGSVLGVGKYLSPKLYVGYGVSLLGTGQVLTLKYLLRKGFDIEVESSTVENRASVNWRLER
ncbi:MAG TPA: translocation/assembly module TamB domain-containing protein [Luteimonas sp.]|nr:translocation/assembly module TamB domain-containing protein [Luteimonas sp.]